MEQTAVTEILEHCKKLIAEGHQIDTQGLVHWIEDTLLDKEMQQRQEDTNHGYSQGYDDGIKNIEPMKPELLTFKSE
jgi:hypothetical protein